MATVAIFDPPFLTPDYHITMARGPLHPRVEVPPEWFDRAVGPAFGSIKVAAGDNDLTTVGNGKPLGLKVILYGRVTGGDGRPMRRTLVEIWQANASGRYVDRADPWGLPLDPNFVGAGRTLTDDDGCYQFTTIRPAPYPTINDGASGWRAAHIHFSLFGQGINDRIITQMYFPDDPMLPTDTIFQGVPDSRARQRLVATFELGKSPVDTANAPGFVRADDGTLRLKSRKQVGDEVARKVFENITPVRSAMAYRFDIVLRGRGATPIENAA